MFWTHHWTATLIHIPSTERLQGLWRRLRNFFARNPVKTESRLSCMLIDYKFQRSLIVNQANSVTQVRLTNWISLKMSWNLRCGAHLSRPVRLFFFFSSAIDTNTHTKIEETHLQRFIWHRFGWWLKVMMSVGHGVLWDGAPGGSQGIFKART